MNVTEATQVSENTVVKFVQILSVTILNNLKHETGKKFLEYTKPTAWHFHFEKVDYAGTQQCSLASVFVKDFLINVRPQAVTVNNDGGIICEREAIKYSKKAEKTKTPWP
jgi:hypothetical protein